MIKAAALLMLSLFMAGSVFAFEEEITVPAESPGGVVINLKKGEYIITITGGAIALFYPINPNYRWLIGVAVGTDVDGGQDMPNIGMLYYEPTPPVHTQSEAERQALAAVKEKLRGTYLKFTLNEDMNVRFWVGDFDYTDNSGMVKLKISSI
jgi:hypothetical protein